MKHVLAPLISVALLCACEDDPLGPQDGEDAEVPDSPLQQDAGGGPRDAAADSGADPIDAEPIDAEPIDAEPIDAEPIDAEPIDAEPIDADGGPLADGGSRTPVSDRCARTLSGSCTSDSQCETGGCGFELCGPGASGMVTMCDCAPDPSWTCGCVDGACAWCIGP